MLDKYRLFTKTYSKTEFLLKDEDIENLKNYKGKSHYGMATYYIKEDIINCACEKYNTTYNNILNTINDIK